MGITSTNIYGSQSPCMLHVPPLFLGTPINPTGGIFTNGKGLSASIPSFVNSTTGIWSAPYFINAECATKDTPFDAFSTSFSLHDSVDLLYCDSILHSHIILSGRCHIMNWCCKTSDSHLCTTCGTLASDSKIFCSPLQPDSNMNSDPNK